MIVARNQSRLAEALAYVSVSYIDMTWKIQTRQDLSIMAPEVSDSIYRLQQRTQPSSVSPPYQQT